LVGLAVPKWEMNTRSLPRESFSVVLAIGTNQEDSPRVSPEEAFKAYLRRVNDGGFWEPARVTARQYPSSKNSRACPFFRTGTAQTIEAALGPTVLLILLWRRG